MARNIVTSMATAEASSAAQANTALRVSVGQHSQSGRKPVNQDFHGLHLAPEPLQETKGIAIALADGISSSELSQVASELSVSGFFSDYFSTPESWDVRKSVVHVLNALNSWLYSQTRRSEHRYNLDKGYVCTFSGMIMKSGTAHLFHVGDARICRLQGQSVEILTREHRIQVSQDRHYLKAAMGMDPHLGLDYRSLPLQLGDVFVLMTDGVHEYVSDNELPLLYDRHADNLDLLARELTALAYRNGSPDNLTVQIVRIDALPDTRGLQIQGELSQLPFPPQLEAGQSFEHYRILRQLHTSSRSHVYLAEDQHTAEQLVLKVPASDLRNDPALLERFVLEEWIARRIDNVHVLKPHEQQYRREHLYIVTEYIDGQTLTQWMTDNPCPDLERVRVIVEQIARALQAFHRLEMLHQDLRPENIMLERNGNVKLIDFGSTRVAGLEEIATLPDVQTVPGTLQYCAPEYFMGEYGSNRSDQFSLAAITYQLLSGRLPYGSAIARARTRSAQRRLTYQSVLSEDREIPLWVDFALRKALAVNPQNRYPEISEFVHDLRKPGSSFVNQTRTPLLQRNPVAFWRTLCVLLMLIIVALLARQ